MKKNRLIPLLLLKNGWLVQSREFNRYQNLGNPITAVKRLSEWGSDELIFLDISKDAVYDTRRDDQGYPNRQSFLEIIEDIARVTFMPITIGGRVRTLQDMEKYLSLGGDKISINTQALIQPSFITEAAKEFGAQCVVVSIDVKKIEGKYRVYSHPNGQVLDVDPLKWAKEVEDKGAGEILLNSVDRDGMSTGYDLELIREVSSGVSVPVIACGGVGEWEHFLQGLSQTKADAIAAANIFHYRDQSVFLAKKYLFEKGAHVRRPDLIKLN